MTKFYPLLQALVLALLTTLTVYLSRNILLMQLSDGASDSLLQPILLGTLLLVLVFYIALTVLHRYCLNKDGLNKDGLNSCDLCRDDLHTNAIKAPQSSLSQNAMANRQRLNTDMHSLLKLNGILRAHLGSAKNTTHVGTISMMAQLENIHQKSESWQNTLNNQQRHIKQYALDQQRLLLTGQIMLETFSTLDNPENKERIAQQFTELGHASKAFAEDFLASVEKGVTDRAVVFSSVLAMLDVVQFEDISRQQIEQVQSALLKLDGYCSALAAQLEQPVLTAIALPPLEDIIQSVQQSYVMHSQHAVHQGVLGDAVEDDVTARIELF